jgi:prevent-host-death family protein
MAVWSASEARAALPEILDRVDRGEEAIITRHGRPVAVVVRPDGLRARLAENLINEAAKLRERIDAARHASQAEDAISRRRAQALADVVRANRDSR